MSFAESTCACLCVRHSGKSSNASSQLIGHAILFVGRLAGTARRSNTKPNGVIDHSDEWQSAVRNRHVKRRRRRGRQDRAKPAQFRQRGGQHRRCTQRTIGQGKFRAARPIPTNQIGERSYAKYNVEKTPAAFNRRGLEPTDIGRNEFAATAVRPEQPATRLRQGFQPGKTRSIMLLWCSLSCSARRPKSVQSNYMRGPAFVFIEQVLLDAGEYTGRVNYMSK